MFPHEPRSVNAPLTPSALGAALAQARQWLAADPQRAAAQAGAVLEVIPDHPLALLIRGTALRRCGSTDEAIGVLSSLARLQPHSAAAQLELGMAYKEARDQPHATAAFERAVRLKPDSADGWRLLAEQLDVSGNADQADAARAQYLKAANRDPRLMQAAAALVSNELPRADALLLTHLAAHPADVAALRMRAEVAGRLRLYQDAEQLLRRCLELAPSFHAARHNLATVLNRQGRAAEALTLLEELLTAEPGNPGYLNSKAAALANVGDYQASIECYERVLQDFPQQPRIWMSFGHSLRTAGRMEEAVRAYRRAISMEPRLGEAYWSLANLKTFRFDDADVTAIRAALQLPDLDAEERVHFEFSLGKALEDARDYGAAFAHYSAGNALRRGRHPYSADDNTRFVERMRELFTPSFLAAHAAGGNSSPEPIFIVGLPRAGSTLVEQILASHSQVEGTMELPDLPQLARALSEQGEGLHGERLFARLRTLGDAEARDLGTRYLQSTRVHRKLGRPFFIDKMPNNCLYVGLIQLILPRAKIIDARRHPLACCLSNVKQHFARGQNFTYDLGDIGRYYHDYVALLAHFDKVLPGRIYRVRYESMVEDTEGQVRRLLEYCGLPFESSCLQFYENARPVRTASSEQVRQPIFREGLGQWRHFEPWLGPLRQALGEVLTSYPEVPADMTR